jgi:hypothetical protein
LEGLHEVKNWEQEDPDEVNEMPEKAAHLYPIGKPFRIPTI